MNTEAIAPGPASRLSKSIGTALEPIKDLENQKMNTEQNDQTGDKLPPAETKTAELSLPYVEPVEDMHQALNDSPSALDALTDTNSSAGVMSSSNSSPRAMAAKLAVASSASWKRA